MRGAIFRGADDHSGGCDRPGDQRALALAPRRSGQRFGEHPALVRRALLGLDQQARHLIALARPFRQIGLECPVPRLQSLDVVAIDHVQA